MCDAPYALITVAKQSFVGQTASIASTTLYTPAADGDFLVSAYVVLDPSGSAGDAAVHVSWTDSYGAKTRLWADVPSAPSLEMSQVLPIHAVAGEPIQFSVAYAFDTIPQAYDVYMTVVKE